MPTWIFGGIFLLLFALVMLSVSLSMGYLNKQRTKKVEEMLRQTSGADSRFRETTILSEEVAKASPSLSKLPLYKTIADKMRLGDVQGKPEMILIGMVVLSTLGALLGLRVETPVIREATMIGLALGFGFIPYAFVSFKARKRMGAFEELFPEALDFLARSMRAGHAFSVSLEMMAEETPDPVGTEFRWIFHEQNLGAPLDVTLRNFAERIPLLDTKLFVSAVMLQRETGGNLAEILTKLAYIIRERFRLKGQVRAASAHGRITALILSVMPVVTLLLLNLVAPEYFASMMKDEHGRWIVVLVIFLQLVGYYWMKRIINIKV